MREWYTATDLAGMPGLPTTRQNVTIKAQRENWPSRPRKGRGGGREYRVVVVSAVTMRALMNGEDHA